jgi:hypothetical protein
MPHFKTICCVICTSTFTRESLDNTQHRHEVHKVSPFLHICNHILSVQCGSKLVSNANFSVMLMKWGSKAQILKSVEKGWETFCCSTLKHYTCMSTMVEPQNQKCSPTHSSKQPILFSGPVGNNDQISVRHKIVYEVNNVVSSATRGRLGITE